MTHRLADALVCRTCVTSPPRSPHIHSYGHRNAQGLGNMLRPSGRPTHELAHPGAILAFRAVD